MESSYITSAAEAHQLPPPNLPEVAFVGRSNCGKSSLINALLGRAKLARESRTPGRTQMVNFFELKSGEHRMLLVDLPGFGYAAAGREVRQHWQSLIDAYVRRPTIKRFYFLMDARRASDAGDEDKTLLLHLARLRPVVVVLTKSDKADQRTVADATRAVASWFESTNVSAPEAIVGVSSLKKKGIEGLKVGLHETLTS